MMLLNLHNLLDEGKCYEQLREMRWPEGRECPECQSKSVILKGYADVQEVKRRYECKGCGCRFNDLTGTIFEGHHQPLKVWMLALYLMGLNVSNAQIAEELGIDPDDCQDMTLLLREGVVKKKA